MVEADPLRVPACLPAKLLQDEGLQQLAQRSAILHQRVGVETQQGADEPRVADVQFWRLDQAAQAVAVPRREFFQKKDPCRSTAGLRVLKMPGARCTSSRITRSGSLGQLQGYASANRKFSTPARCKRNVIRPLPELHIIRDRSHVSSGPQYPASR